MAQNSKQRKIKDLIHLFQEQMENGAYHFFDIEEIENLFNHFTDRSYYSKALKICVIGTELYPFSVDMILLKSQALVNLERYNQALDIIEDAIIIQPNDDELLIMKANILSLREEYIEAVQVLEQALTISSNKDDIYFQIGLAYQNASDFDMAIVSYKQAVEENMQHDGALYELAYCLDITGALEDSLGYYKKFIDSDPYSHLGWYNLGIIYHKLGKNKEAESAYQYAILIKEDYVSKSRQSSPRTP